MISKRWTWAFLIGVMASSAHANEVTLLRDMRRSAYQSLAQQDFRKSLQIWYIKNILPEVPGDEIYVNQLKSAAWLTIDRLDLCPLNMPQDNQGYGIWPMVLHNYMIRQFRRSRGRLRSVATIPDHSLQTFQRGVQKRPIYLDSLLSPSEIASVDPFRGHCPAYQQILQQFGSDQPGDDDNDRQVMARTLKALLQTGLNQPNLNADIKSYLNYRVLLIRVFLAEQQQNQPGHQLFAELMALPKEKWLALPPNDRRSILVLYHSLEHQDQAAYHQALERALVFEMDAPGPALTDELIGLRSGGRRDLEFLRSDVVRRLLAQGEAGAFKEVAAMAGPLAIEAYQRGDLTLALRLLATCLNHSKQSSHAGNYYLQAMSWIKYILIKHRFDRHLLDFVKSYLPLAEFKKLQKELIWSAAFYREPYLFSDDLAVWQDSDIKTRQLVMFLRPLAQRRDEGFFREIQKGLRQSPRQTLGWIEELLIHLEPSPLALIKNQRRLLEATVRALSQLPPQNKFLTKKAAPIIAKINIMLSPFVESTDIGTTSQAIEMGGLVLEPSYDWPWPFPLPLLTGVDVFREIPLFVEQRAGDTYAFSMTKEVY